MFWEVKYENMNLTIGLTFWIIKYKVSKHSGSNTLKLNNCVLKCITYSAQLGKDRYKYHWFTSESDRSKQGPKYELTSVFSNQRDGSDNQL